MKKVLFIYGAVLLGIFAVFFVLGQKGEYVVERKVWKLYQQQIDIAKDPAVIPEITFQNILDEYRQIIKKYPDSRLAPELHIRLGEVYVLKKDYEEARKAFREMIGLYQDDPELLAEAMFKIGETYELSQNWPQAQSIYDNVIRDYPQTNTALNIPIYIANYYRKQNDFQRTMEAYERAALHYTQIASDYDNSRVGLDALRYLANCYFEQNRWKETINISGLIIEKYAGSGYLAIKDVDMIIKTVNIVAAYKLNDYDVAIQLYEGIIDRNPGHPLRDYLKKVIDAFNQLKEKGIQVSDQKIR